MRLKELSNKTKNFLYKPNVFDLPDHIVRRWYLKLKFDFVSKVFNHFYQLRFIL